ncbi:IS1 family transposase [Cyanobacteria bacterium FACHB-472]|nr:IS1 family transposase [Cyanobacteria bacterium FACHB-472]
MLTSRPDCPRCGSNHIVKNGRIHNKNPKYKCQNCGRQFVEISNNKIIDKHRLDYIDKMLLEKIPLVGIARVTSVSKKWLQNYVNTKYASVPQQTKVSSKHSSKLNIECDVREALPKASFVIC